MPFIKNKESVSKAGLPFRYINKPPDVSANKHQGALRKL